MSDKWVTVPVETDFDMWKAAQPHLQDMVDLGAPNATDFDAAYLAALAAAPKPDNASLVSNVHGDNHVQLFPGTLRDWFAGQALAGICSRHESSLFAHEAVSVLSYAIADAALKAREQSNG